MPVITTLHSQQCFCVFFLCSSWQGTQNIFHENKIKKTRRIFHSYFAVVASVVGSTDHFSAVAAEPSLAEFGYLAFEKNLARCGSSKKEPNITLPCYVIEDFKKSNNYLVPQASFPWALSSLQCHWHSQ